MPFRAAYSTSPSANKSSTAQFVGLVFGHTGEFGGNRDLAPGLVGGEFQIERRVIVEHRLEGFVKFLADPRRIVEESADTNRGFGSVEEDGRSAHLVLALRAEQRQQTG